MINITEEELVNLFTEFIDWPKRNKGENKFFERILNKHDCKNVFDSSTGEGYDSISLIQAGFDVTSNEVDSNFKKRAINNAQAIRIELKFTSGYDWRSIPNGLSTSFDAVICLGNSLTHLIDREDQEKAVRNFSKIVKSRGIVIIDQRNYDYMLDQREYILQDPRNNFRYSKRFYYCSDTIDAYPIHIDDKKVIMEYLHKSTGKKMHLELYPFRRQELINLMTDCGLKVETYEDFELNKQINVDFFQHIGKKI